MIDRLLSLPGRLAMGALAAFAAYQVVQFSGVKKERARVETQDRKHVSNADAAARASRDPAAGGVLDPYSRKQ